MKQIIYPQRFSQAEIVWRAISNWLVGVCRSMANHPLRDFRVIKTPLTMSLISVANECQFLKPDVRFARQCFGDKLSFAERLCLVENRLH